MAKEIRCDECGVEAPPMVELAEKGWFASLKKSVSGIPLDLLCPKCKFL